MKKKKYTAKQYAQGGAGAAIFVVVGVLVMSWYRTTTAGGTITLNGTEGPFLGLWVIILSVLAGCAAGAYGFSLVPREQGRLLLGVSTALYILCLVLGFVDATRSMPTVVRWGIMASRGPGAATTAFLSFLGAALSGYALSLLAKEEGGRGTEEKAGSAGE